MPTFDTFTFRTGTSKDYERSIQTVCRECTTGCGLWAFTRAERIVDVQGDRANPVNHGRLCARGSEFVRRLARQDRITRVLTRNKPDEAFTSLESCESGMDLLADRLRQLRERYGAESMAVYCHPSGGLDFALGARRFAGLWGTCHVYPTQDRAGGAIAGNVLSSGKLPGTDRPDRGSILLVEADLASSHPVLFGRILEAQRRGIKICAVDSSYTPTMAKADMTRIIRPASGNWFGLCLMKILLEERHFSPASAASMPGYTESWQNSFNRMPSEAALHATGVPLDLLRPLAHFLAGRGPVMVITGRVLGTMDYSRIWPTMAGAMGWSDNPQGGWYPLYNGPPHLDVTGDIPTNEAEAIGPPAPQPLAGHPEASRQPASETAPRIVIFSGETVYEPAFPLEKFMRVADAVVYFGSHVNAALQVCHMAFPAAAWPERDELCFCENSILQWGRRIVAPANDVRTGLDFWSGLARRFGWEEFFPWRAEDGRADLRAFYGWVLEQNPWMQGLQLEAMEGAPCTLDIPGREPAFQEGPMALLAAPDAGNCPGIHADADRFPLLHAVPADSGDEQPPQGMPSGQRLTGECDLLIHPEIGMALAIQTGETVIVRNDQESWKAKAWLTRSVPVWMVRSLRRGAPSRVLVHRAGEAPERSLAALKAMGL